MTTSVDDQYRLLHDLRGLVRLHRDFGILDYPRTTGIDQFLKPGPVSAPPPPEIIPNSTSREMPRPKPTPAPQTPSRPVQTLREIETELGNCTRCTLHQSRERLLFGTGSPNSRLFIIGDFPTCDDEKAGTPFGGEPGELLTKMLKAIGLERTAVYITTTVKCRAANNAPPQPEHIATCLPVLFRQIDAVAPKLICTMGPISAQALLKTDTPLVRLRGRFHQCRGIELMPTFHPSFLIKNPDMKKATWIDLQLIQARLA